jgi:oxaloacetate decarboxylase (Na+ extruding) subunit gamma
MESNLNNALLLLVIGMCTVFFILFIVVTGGKVLINIVNKIKVDTQDLPFAKINTDTIHPSKVAAIHAAVQLLTNGKAKVDKIDKK